MRFRHGSPHQIKSISQRNLVLYWDRLHGDRHLPALAEFSPDARMHEPKQLAVWQVDRQSRPPAFRALQVGAFITEAIGAAWERKTLDELTPPSLLPFFKEASDACAGSGCGVYSILRTRHESGATTDLERLLLPFGGAGAVEFIVASLQLFGSDVQPERRKTRDRFERNTSEILAIRIPPSRQAA